MLLAAACDHPDRALQVHGVAWSKNAGLDVLSSRAWRMVEVADHLDVIHLCGWVKPDDGADAGELVQDATLAALLPRGYRLEILRDRGLLRTGTVLLGGTVAMIAGVDPFAGRWTVRLDDPLTGDGLVVTFRVDLLPESVG